MLKVGTVLHGTYRIDGYLSSGGFGNTYVATNIEFDEKYAIKEFFMRGISQRDGNNTTVSVSNADNEATFDSQREKFKKEARRLRRLNSDHIVRVYDLFEENGTAYYVMDFIDGESLSELLKRTGSPLLEAEVIRIFPQILDALDTAHKEGIWHLDLKPANIMLDKNGVVKLIDFGASKQQSATGGATTSTAVSYTNGYAPREQMEQNLDKFGPWTDFYALGATLYNLLTNKKPPLPSDIDDDTSVDKHLSLPMPSISNNTKKLVLWLMETNRNNRPQSVANIRDYVNGNLHATSTNTTKTQVSPQNNAKSEETILIGKRNSVSEEDELEYEVEDEDNDSPIISFIRECRTICYYLSFLLNPILFLAALGIIPFFNFWKWEGSSFFDMSILLAWWAWHIFVFWNVITERNYFKIIMKAVIAIIVILIIIGLYVITTLI